MIKSYGYTPHVRHLIGWTGTAQALFAPFGCFSVNIAAISAAISLDDQSHPDSRKRYIAGISCGLCYILMGIFAATLTSLLMSFPLFLLLLWLVLPCWVRLDTTSPLPFKIPRNEKRHY